MSEWPREHAERGSVMNECSLLRRVIANVFRPSLRPSSPPRPSYFESLESRLLLSAADGMAIPPSDWRDTPALPLLQSVFERNVGQASAEYEYFARGFGYDLSLARDEVVIDLKSGAAQTASGDASASATPALRMRWLDAQDPLSLSGHAPVSGVVNYLDVDDPARSVLGVPMFGEVVYDEVYAGIDLVFYERDGYMEFDWIVAAGATPGDIRMSYEGADELSLGASGELLISTPLGLLTQRAPVLYQTAAGERVAVDGAYRLEADGTVGFAIGDYDRTRALVIDPVLDFAGVLGGGAQDQVSGIAVDADGAIYVTGTTFSTDFPITTGVLQDVLSPGDQAAFVTKYDATGAIVWSTYIGRENADPDRVVEFTGVDLALDGANHIYIAGWVFDETLEPGTEPNGNDNIWIAKLDSTGGFLHYETVIAGRSSHVVGSSVLLGGAIDVATGITVDADGRAYVVGWTNSHDLPVTGSALDAVLGDGNPVNNQFDPFLAILDAHGSVSYLTYLGGVLNDFANAVALDDTGNVVIAGSTVSPDLHVTLGAVREQNLSGDGSAHADGFVTILDPIGSDYLYSTLIGGGFDDFVNDMVVRDGDIYLVGTTSSDDFPQEGAAPPAFADVFGSAFVARLSPDLAELELSSLVFSTVFGGSGPDGGSVIAVDHSGQIHVGGQTRSRDFILADPLQAQIGGLDVLLPGMEPPKDGFVARLSPDGAHMIFSTFLGGASADEITGIAFDPSGRTIVVGNTGALPQGGIGEDAFIAALSARSIVAGRALSIAVDVPFNGVVATFDAMNPLLEAEHYEATIDWGDGTTSAGLLIRRPGIGVFGGDAFEVLGTHTYSETGAYPVVVRVAGLLFDSPVNNINVSRYERSQVEPRVVVHPSDPNILFMTAIDEGLIGSDALGLFTARSLDGGRTWSPAIIADGRDNLAAGKSIAAAAFDSVGRLIVAYVGAEGNKVMLAVSPDLGQTFVQAPVELFTTAGPSVGAADIDSIAIAIAANVNPLTDAENEIVVAYNSLGGKEVRVAALTPGADSVQTILSLGVAVEGNEPGAVDVAIGPTAQTIVLWQESGGIGTGSASIYVSRGTTPGGPYSA
ncbi:MAG: hypothetical protein EHM59_10610, partial [Betaproteobacteria bacterium]